MNIGTWLRARPTLRQLLMPGILLRRALFVEPSQRRQRSLFSHVAGGTIAFDVAAFDGHFDIDARSDLAHRLMLEGAYETEFAVLCRSVIDRTRDAIDVGANVGFYSVLIGKLLGQGRRILAIEPTQRAHDLLLRNLARNSVSNAIAVKAIAAASTGEKQLNVCIGREEYSSVVPISHASVTGADKIDSVCVAATTIDTLCAIHGLRPGFIKLDVEGYEHQVLLGATTILREQRPTLLVEVNDASLMACGSSRRDLLAWLRKFGYRVHDAATRREAKDSVDGYVIAVPIWSRTR